MYPAGFSGRETKWRSPTRFPGRIRRRSMLGKVAASSGHVKPMNREAALVPPKYSVALALGFLKSNSAARIQRELLGERRMTGLHFWARGHCVSTVGLDEQQIRQYIREQEELEKNQGELDLQ